MNTMTPSPLIRLSHVDICYPAFFPFHTSSGVLADMFDRKKLLCFKNLWLALVEYKFAPRIV